MPVEMVKRPDNWRYAPISMGTSYTFSPTLSTDVILHTYIDTRAGENVFVKVPAGKVTIGKAHDFPSYGWDLDYGHFDVE